VRSPFVRPLTSFAFSFLLAAGVARGAEPVRMEFERAAGAETCPDRDAFEAVVAARLGSTPWSVLATRVVRITFTPAGAGILGRMDLLQDGASLGSREIRSVTRDCHETAESLALAVALTLDPPGFRSPKSGGGSSNALLDSLPPDPDGDAFDEIADATPVATPIASEPVISETPPIVAPPAARRGPGRPVPVQLFAGVEGGYSYWSGGTEGFDEAYQSSARGGEVAAGGTTPLGKYTLDVLVSGYAASKTDRRTWKKYDQFGRDAHPRDEYVSQSIGATAMRAALRSEAADSAVALGVLVGGFQETGCRHDRTGVRDWPTPLCSELQQWAAFPTFGVRMGPVSGPYATLGFLDGRSLSGSLAHLGAGAILPGDIRLDVSVVATVEGLGSRVELAIPVGKRAVLLPSVGSGVLYDTFLDIGGRNNWVRAGFAIGLRQ
jgi:hypothetical protein